MYLQHVLALSKNWFHLRVLSLEQPPNNLSLLLEVRDLKGAERGSIQTYEERFTFLPGTSGTSWSLQQHGMFSMTESISWLSPETSERCVRWLNPVQGLLEGGKAAVLENNPDTHLWFVKQKMLKGFSLPLLPFCSFLKPIFSHWLDFFLTVSGWITQSYKSLCISNGKQTWLTSPRRRKW